MTTANPVYVASFPGDDWRPTGTAFADTKSALWGTASPRAALIEWIMVMKLLKEFGAKIIVMPPPSYMSSRHRSESGTSRRARKKFGNIFDIVYAADIGAWFPGLGFLFSNMHAEHRKGETDYGRWFFKNELRLKIFGQAESEWEGLSCKRSSPRGTTEFLGYGVRASRESCDEIGKLIRRINPRANLLNIQMKKPHIHLDTLLGSLTGSIPIVVVCPAAFAAADGKGWNPKAALDELWYYCGIEGSLPIPVSAESGEGYVTNFREETGGRVFSPTPTVKGSRMRIGLSGEYVRRIERCGYKIHPMRLPCLYELGGGAAACLTNDVTAAAEEGWIPPGRYLFDTMLPYIESLVERYPDYQLAA